jgi:hypothetical protein
VTSDKLIFFGTFAVIFLMLISGCISTLEYPRDLQKNERYQLVVDSSGPLSDATFYVPLPVKNGVPMIGDKQLYANDFSKEGFAINFIQTPPGYNLSGFYPGDFSLAGNNPWYMKIHRDTWPVGREEWLKENGTFDLTSPLLFSNTLFPIGNESILLPKLEFSESTYPTILHKYPEYGNEYFTPVETRQSAMVYANYSTTGEATVTIYILIHGDNNWRDRDDTGGHNYYLDEIYGPISMSRGWNEISGRFSVANGPYPDLDQPGWQRLVQRNRSSSD